MKYYSLDAIDRLIARYEEENAKRCSAFGYSEADIQAALDVITDLQWFMSYELANTYSNFDGKKFEELCKA